MREEGFPKIMGRRGFLLGQSSPLTVGVTNRGLMRDGESGQALELIRPEAAVLGLRHALTWANGVMSFSMGVSRRGAGEKEDETNKDDKLF